METECTVQGCFNKMVARGLCKKHHQRWLRNGHTGTTRRPYGAALKFIETASQFEGSECLPWPLYKDRNGYGRVNCDGAPRLAHRLVCLAVHGAAPVDRPEAAHNCGNPACVNPKHLRWASAAENTADKYAHGTMRLGESCPSAKLSESEVREIKKLKAARTAQLANKFGVSPSTIADIQKNRTWRHVEVGK